jgi:hypothetical protein
MRSDMILGGGGSFRVNGNDESSEIMKVQILKSSKKLLHIMGTAILCSWREVAFSAVFR